MLYRQEPHVPRMSSMGEPRIKEIPALESPKIRYAATYYDGIILSPERLSLEFCWMPKKKANMPGSLNYVSMVSGNGDRVTLKDDVTGQILILHHAWLSTRPVPGSMERTGGLACQRITLAPLKART